MKYWCLNNDIKMKKIIRTSILMILISSCSEGYIPIEETTQIPPGPATKKTKRLYFKRIAVFIFKLHCIW